MRFKITGRDEAGKPSYVHIDDGFCETSRPYDEERDGWMENQLDPRDFIAIQIGYDTADLVAEVNALRRENFRLNKELESWRKIPIF